IDLDAVFRGSKRQAAGDLTGAANRVVQKHHRGALQLRVLDRKTGKLLRALQPFAKRMRGSGHVVIADVNGDGQAELLAEAGGRVAIYLDLTQPPLTGANVSRSHLA